MNHDAIERETFSRKSLGFWIYLMTDCVLFACLFVTFVVLRTATANGPTGAEIFDMPFVLTETMLLLASSFTIGLATLAAVRKLKVQTIVWLVLTFLLGASFLAMELYEFGHLIAAGHDWTQSAFLSAFFTLVGTHGFHIVIGLIWLGTMIFRLIQRNFKQTDVRRLLLLSVFWHFLDVIWIFVFSVVYLIGGM